MDGAQALPPGHHPGRVQAPGGQGVAHPHGRGAGGVLVVAGRAWTVAERKVLREFADCGAKAVVRKLRSLCGTRRTTAAVQMQASRMGVTLVEHYTCSRCGGVFPRRSYNKQRGLCLKCSALSYYPQQRAGAEIRAAMPDPEEFAREVAEARKANAARRQKAHRDSVKEL
nr:MAG TPA: RING finger family protein [Caudoviricetes sp.]